MKTEKQIKDRRRRLLREYKSLEKLYFEKWKPAHENKREWSFERSLWSLSGQIEELNWMLKK